MNSIEVLRDSLDEHAEGASDVAGLLDDVRAGAVRLRRRRRMVTGAGVLAAAVVATLAVGQLPRPAATPAAPYSRSVLQLTAGVAPGSGFELQGYATSGDVQRLVLGGEILAEVHDPGPYDPSTLAGAQRIDLGGGSTGFALPAFISEEPLKTPVSGVARRDPTGAWVIAYGPAPQDRLARAAVAVRIGPPRDVKVPFRLGSLPEGLRVSSADSRPAGVTTILSFQDPSRQLALQVVSQVADNTQYASKFGPPTPVAGYDTWYLTKANSDWFADSDAVALLVQYQLGCNVLLRSSDSRTVTRAMLEQIARDTRFGSCADQTTWTSPLG